MNLKYGTDRPELCGEEALKPAVFQQLVTLIEEYDSSISQVINQTREQYSGNLGIDDHGWLMTEHYTKIWNRADSDTLESLVQESADQPDMIVEYQMDPNANFDPLRCRCLRVSRYIHREQNSCEKSTNPQKT